MKRVSGCHWLKTLSQSMSDFGWSKKGKDFTVQLIPISSLPLAYFTHWGCYHPFWASFLHPYKSDCNTCQVSQFWGSTQAPSGNHGSRCSAPSRYASSFLPEGPCQTYVLFWYNRCVLVFSEGTNSICFLKSISCMPLALEGLCYSLNHLAFSIQLAQHRDFKSSLKINLIPNMIYNVPSNSSFTRESAINYWQMHPRRRSSLRTRRWSENRASTP